jgi:aminopeptidase
MPATGNHKTAPGEGMLTDRQIERYADVLIWGLKTARARALQKNDIVAVRFNLPAVRLAEKLHAKLLVRGVHPVLRFMATPVMEQDFYALATGTQLTFSPPGEKRLLRQLNGSIMIHAPQSLTHLRDINPAKIGKAAVSQKKLRDILTRREALGKYSWTLCMFPTRALAKHANVSVEAYTRQIAKACFLNKTAPVARWQEIYRNAKTIKKWLNSLKVHHYHIQSEHIDLIVTPGENRRWVGISGRNIPSFELFVSPDWRGTSGVFYADQPSFRSGNLVKGVKMEFKNGQAQKISAQAGEHFLKKQLAMDNGADKLGEFSLTDKRFSRIDRFMANTLFDENYGGKYGNCHIALGSSYANTFNGDPVQLSPAVKKKLGFNDSALHWDFVNTEKKRVVAQLNSGKRITIYENGKFQY